MQWLVIIVIVYDAMVNHCLRGFDGSNDWSNDWSNDGNNDGNNDVNDNGDDVYDEQYELKSFNDSV